MMVAPALAPDSTPLSPRITASESGESGSIVTMASIPEAQALGESAAVAPSEASSSTGGLERLCTLSSKPALRRLRAMGFPMMPKPTNPTFLTSVTTTLLETADYNARRPMAS